MAMDFIRFPLKSSVMRSDSITGSLAVGTGRATVESRIVHEGRRVVHAASTVTDERGKTVALGDATLMIVLGKRSAGESKEKSASEA